MTITRTTGKLYVPRVGSDLPKKIEITAKTTQRGYRLPAPIRFETDRGTWYLLQLDYVLSYPDRMEISGAGSFDARADHLDPVLIKLELRTLTNEGTIKFQ